MSHELSIRADGFVEMAYTGDMPWHGLGQSINPDASIEEWQEASGLNWRAQRATVRYHTERMFTRDDGTLSGGSPVDWPEQIVLFRSDSKAPLAVVSDGYKVVQPSECLEFFRDLVADAGFKIVTAGALKGGRKIWAQADIGEKEAIQGADMVRGRVLIATSLDGSMQTLVKHVSERVVCANTLGYAVGESGKGVRVSHRSTFDPSRVKADLGLTAAAFHRFMSDMRKLSQVEIDPMQAYKMFAEVLEIDPSAKDYKVTPTEPLSNVVALFSGKGKGSNLLGSKGTAWGWLNAMTEYVDHHARARSVDNRIESAWFGRGETLKQNAMTKALALAA